MIAAFKLMHFATLAVWCAALIALPLMLRNRRLTAWDHRVLTHYGYIYLATPAGVLTIFAGTALIFLVPTHEPWLLVKLALVAGMVGVHRWMGDLILKSGEDPASSRSTDPLIGLLLLVPLITAVLWLVLAKPDLHRAEDWLPEWMLTPQGMGS